jgi:triacylglycerol lipase
MKKCTAVLVFILFLLTFVSDIYAGGSSATVKCETRYPIILAHGALVPSVNAFGGLYWGAIPDALEDAGATVYVLNHRTTGYSYDMATDMGRELAYLFAIHPGWKKVNIIGHSQGTLASRFLIANCNVPGKGRARDLVASLTCISGPHRGSEIADLLTGLKKLMPGVAKYVISAVNILERTIMLQGTADSRAALECLTTKYQREVFNPMTPNQSGVYYQSWAGRITRFDLFSSDMYDITGEAMKLMGAGPNDGMVSISSARWGNFRGELTGTWWSNGVNHGEEVGDDTTGFDIPGFYINVVKELKEKGF